MALEPVEMTAEEPENHELTDMTRRFRVERALAAPVLVLAMIERLPWCQLALATPVVLWGGAPFFARGWQSIVNRSPNMFTLIALGVGWRGPTASWRRSRPACSPPSFRMPTAASTCTSRRQR
jgi:Cu+-exporting ATPase